MIPWLFEKSSFSHMCLFISIPIFLIVDPLSIMILVQRPEEMSFISWKSDIYLCCCWVVRSLLILYCYNESCIIMRTDQINIMAADVPNSSCGHAIMYHAIENDGKMDPCLPWGRIPTTCNISCSKRIEKTIHFMVSPNNLSNVWLNIFRALIQYKDDILPV